MRYIATIILLIASLCSSVGFSDQFQNSGNNSQVIQTLEGPSFVSGDHDCPQQNSNSHGESIPCGNSCHHSGHCHFLFPDINNIAADLLKPYIGNDYNTLHPDPHPDGLFRPPII